ncbi:MAG TPA: TolC family protein [Spirochaetales bacterium]|nr:TolC family protein [Spirochaetales bacterium]
MKRSTQIFFFRICTGACLLFAQLSGTSLEGQPTEPISIDVYTATALALRSNLGIELEQLSLDIKKNTKDTVYNYFYPKVSASVKLNRLNEAPSTVSTLLPYGAETPTPLGTAYDKVLPYSYTPPHRFELGTAISANLALSYSMIHGIRIAQLDYEAGRISLETARKKVGLDVQKNFYNLLVIEESIKLAEQNLQAAITRYNQARENYLNGLVDQYTMLSAQVAVEVLKPGIVEIRNGYETALLSFKLLLGIDLDTPIRLEGSIDPEILLFDARELSSRFLDNRLDIQRLVIAQKITDTSSKLERSNLLPVLSFLYTVDPTFSGDPFKDSWFDKDWNQRSGMFGITVSISLDNFIPGSSQQNKIYNAQMEQEKVGVQLAQALQAADLEIRKTVMGLEKSARSIEALKLNVELAEQANQMGQEAYRAGLKDYSQIETTEVNLQEAKVNLLKEKYNYLAGLLDLEYALNTSIETLKGLSR